MSTTFKPPKLRSVPQVRCAEGRKRGRGINVQHRRENKTTRKAGRALALLSITALALAASPTALAADDRGGPGAPSVQQLDPTAFFGVPKAIQRFASWSD
jgi:hypothetical protein